MKQTKSDIIIREYPRAVNDFLRFQVGRMQTRSLKIALTDSKNRIVAEREITDEPVGVFHLLGFGSTLKKAQAMAAKNRG